MAILILSSLFSSDLLNNSKYFENNLNKNKYNYISPMMVMRDEDWKNLYSFGAQMIAASTALSKKFNEYFKKANDKETIYFGPATYEATFDKIIVIDKNVVNAQEALVNDIMIRLKKDNNFYRAEQATMEFKTIQEAMEYLNNV